MRERLGLDSGGANRIGTGSGRADSRGYDYPGRRASGYDGDSHGSRPASRASAVRDRYGDVRTADRLPRNQSHGRDDQADAGMRTWSHWPWHRSWWRHWTLKKVALLLAGLIATLLVALIGLFVIAYATVQVPLKALSSPLQQSSTVYFADGRTEVGTFSSVNRTVLTPNQISESAYLTKAVIAAEDRHFETEGGISVTGLVRALLVDVSGSGLQGGSTITEQLVKNYYDPAGNGHLSVKDKLKEVIVAIKLAKLKSKTWILTNYLNTIYLGSGAYGVQAAAETYFGRPAWDLNVAQAAMIAAMINQPGSFNPEPGTGYWHVQLVARWRYVLGNMARDGAISQQTANAQTFPKVKEHGPGVSWNGYRGYVMYLVQNELEADYGYSQAQIYGGGLQIRTTISKRLMSALYSAVSQNKRLMAQYGVPMPRYVHIAAVLEQPGTGAIRAFYGGPGYGVRHCKQLRCQLNSELAPEPVGSSFKPYVLATAVAQGMNVQDSVTNSHSPLCIPPDWTATLRMMRSQQTLNCNTSQGYWLFNEANENYGQNLPVPYATAFSNDPAYEDLIHRAGIQNVINMAAQLGVSSSEIAGLNAQFGNGCRAQHPHCTPGSVVMALGQGSLTAVDQANTFATLVSGGTSATPHVISSVVQNGIRIPSKVRPPHPALTAAQAADADYALSFDTTLPGATGLNAAWNRPVIAKTGTLGQGNNASEAWFIGAIPQYSLSIGMFTDHPGPPQNQVLDGLPGIGGIAGSYGGAWPATIWHTFMTGQFNTLPVLQLPTPDYTGFTQWIQASPLPVPKKHQHCVPQPTSPCPSQSPTGTPSPTGSPTPSPSGTPSPTPSVTPTPPPARPPGQHRAGHRPARGPSAPTFVAADRPRATPRPVALAA